MSRRRSRPTPEPALPVEDEAVEAEASLPAPLSSERSVEPVDAITAYMAELRHHAPISREEEHALAVRWTEEGDLEAARQLVLANLRWVVKSAMEYRRGWTYFLDLIL